MNDDIAQLYLDKKEELKKKSIPIDRLKKEQKEKMDAIKLELINSYYPDIFLYGKDGLIRLQPSGIKISKVNRSEVTPTKVLIGICETKIDQLKQTITRLRKDANI